MSEIKAVERLREWIDYKINRFDVGENALLLNTGANPNELYDFADEIEAEIAERFHLLPEGWTAEQAEEMLGYWPKWDDGTPCMFGDEFTCYPKYDYEQKYEVLDRLVIFGQNHVWNRGCDDENPHNGGYYEWNYMRPGGDDCESYRPTKRKPRTLEDVLRDVWKEALDYAKSDIWRNPDEVFAERADEIRDLLGGDAE